MKKIFVLAAVACTLASVACQKNNGKEDEGAKVVKRVAVFSEVGDGWADRYQFTYDADGRPVKVFREEGKEWTITYEGNTAHIVGASDVDYVCTLNEKGLCTSLSDKWEDTFTFSYDKDGRLTSIDKGEVNKTTVTLEDGCIVTWTRVRDEQVQTKNHKYISTKNVGNIHNIYPEVYPLDRRFLMELGFFGLGTAYLCGENQWAHAEEKGVLTYDFDEDGFVVKEHKAYPGWPEEFEYEWEIVK